jgi:hypothetical protein
VLELPTTGGTTESERVGTGSGRFEVFLRPLRPAGDADEDAAVDEAKSDGGGYVEALDASDRPMR